MKKIFTLALGLVLSIAMFAADRRPVVTVSTNRKFEVVIDGRNYGSGSISSVALYGGRHTVAVYETGRSLFFNSRRMVSSSSFQMRNSDIAISVDRFGQMNISESRQTGWNDGNGRFDSRDAYQSNNSYDNRDMHQGGARNDSRDAHQNDNRYSNRDVQQNDRNSHDKRGH
jgi:hypothetical protein